MRVLHEMISLASLFFDYFIKYHPLFINITGISEVKTAVRNSYHSNHIFKYLYYTDIHRHLQVSTAFYGCAKASIDAKDISYMLWSMEYCECLKMPFNAKG